MNYPEDDTTVGPDWDEARQEEIARRLEESEAQVARGETVPLASLLDELGALADQIEAEQREQQRRGAPTTPR